MPVLEVAMGEARRRAGLLSLLVVLAAAAFSLVTPFAGGATAAPAAPHPAPTRPATHALADERDGPAASQPGPLFRPIHQMTYACVQKGALMRFVETPARGLPVCIGSRGRLVKIPPGPTFVCVHANHEVFL